MKQVIQTLRTGVVEVNNVPVPTLTDTFVLVKTRASVISAGTEKTKIEIGKKNLLRKAKARPDLVRQLLKKLKTEGFARTLQTVNARLNAPNPLGYSSCGEVLAVGGMVEGLKPGDRVACAGAGYANHAELVVVPKNLVALVPEGVSDEEAAFTTIGAIALQGIRLADVKLGEIFLVLGLGLLGQITVQLLKANGCHVIGSDLDRDKVRKAEEYGAQGVPPNGDIIRACLDRTNGHGVDGVLVCAATSSNEPIVLSGAVTREKGRVVVVGAVRMDIPREDYFKKEISVVISRSYGPGRYDTSYEERGRDYPYGYVRFTEKRNMETFLELVAQGKVEVKSLITHRFSVDKAPEAYSLIEGNRKEPYFGIVLNYYDGGFQEGQSRRIPLASRGVHKERIGLSVFGAGNYATASLLPFLTKNSQVEMRGITTASGRTAQSVGQQFGFGFCAASYEELLGDDTDTVLIATHHDTHAEAVSRALRAGKHVYVEKPLGLSVEDLCTVHRAFAQSGGAQLMVGFNRRFAPLTRWVREHFEGIESPMMVQIRVNAGFIQGDHWTQNPEIGGGRLIGEGCHFIDLASALVNSDPVMVYAQGSSRKEKTPLLNDNVVVTVTFANGSVGCIVYTADGSKAMPKEYVEVFGAGKSAAIIDFREAFRYKGDSGCSRKKLMAQDKGQKDMLSAWITGLKKGRPCVPYETLMRCSLATVMAVECMIVGAPLRVDLAVLEDNF